LHANLIFPAKMSAIEFIPKHSQPFTLAQAMQLEIDILVAGECIVLSPLSPLRRIPRG
jgi:hypothetical protein